ncbi:MAG: RidA family protein [Alphaproteobacteria bacterium]|nr:RidA family protein [Alphaproteobacteria bacterium]MBU0805789.1 RidA family protein [Alphaproteobacteria bacterium]MBU0872526.1 RidA family protein [Alphaproteobacteria bacterium]MBU1403021.1 RidA family protein [Alphaproteobacteria bacterium]MBU1593782.1 RidA family protein [Alphaproteobacteria bacterium]
MKKEIIEVPVLSPMMRELGVPCSSVTRANGFVFVAATPPVDMVTGKIVKGDIETQTEASLNAVKLCLAAAGCSFEDVVTLRIYAANVGHYDAINRVYKKHFPDNFPSRSFVPVSGWFMEFDIEIECMAVG